MVEVLFSYPGIGKLLVDGVARKDLPIVQTCGLIFAVTYILLNLLADIASIAANPRLRRPRSASWGLAYSRRPPTGAA